MALFELPPFFDVEFLDGPLHGQLVRLSSHQVVDNLYKTTAYDRDTQRFRTYTYQIQFLRNDVYLAVLHQPDGESTPN